MAWLRHLFDPRGRVNRIGLLFVGLGLLPAEAGIRLLAWGLALPPLHAGVVAVKLVLLWLACVALIKRLHDMGRGATWLLAGLAGFIAWVGTCFVAILAMVQSGVLSSPSMLITVSLVAYGLPLVGGAVFMHCQPGDKARNRFGAPPGPTGFSHPSLADDELSGQVPQPRSAANAMPA
ncbi:MAG: DUF805 domain-containing protein [Pseudomonadota bacterium]